MSQGDIAQDVCKAVRALGFSAPRTRRIVDGVVHDLNHNGPEWVATRIKDLRSYYAGTGEFPGWVRKRSRRDGLLQPRGWMGSLTGTRTHPDTVITVLSTVIGAIVLTQPSRKQLMKWRSAVAKPPISGEFEPPPIRLSEIVGLDQQLKRKMKRRKPFGPDDIHGSRYPVGTRDGVIKRGNGLDMPGLYQAWKDSLLSAPSSAWAFQAQGAEPWPGVSYSAPMVNAMRKQAPDSGKRKPPGKRSGRTLPKKTNYPIGHISFLQEPFGKLRTVANPNRFVQWQLTPLGEVLSDWINTQPGVYNLDQQGGMTWIQSQLKAGYHLTSADLSSASDTLDYRQVLSAFKKDLLPLLRSHLEYFEQCSQSPWFVTNPKAREFVGSSVIRWKQGQPLGLRPSFPVLTITNWMAARQAVLKVDGKESPTPPFAIVGDDIVIHTRYAEEYQRQIALLGGVANLDKACSSDKMAEFCSRLITSDKILRLKARWIPDNPVQNVLTYQGKVPTVRVPSWVRRHAARVGSYALVESGLVPDFNPDQPKPLKVKLLAHAVLSLTREKAITFETKHLESFWLAATERFGDSVSPETKSRPRQPMPEAHTTWWLLPKTRETQVHWIEEFKRVNPGFDPYTLPGKLGMLRGSKRTSSAVPPYLVCRAIHALYEDAGLQHRLGVRWYEPTHPRRLEAITDGSAREQTVETVRTAYDHQSNKRQPVDKPVQSLKRLDRQLSRLSRDLITSDKETALIRRISPTVEELVELKEDGVESTFYGPTQTSPTVRLPIPLPWEVYSEQENDFTEEPEL